MTRPATPKPFQDTSREPDGNGSHLIRIDHRRTVQEIDMNTSPEMRPLTMMELVDAVSEVSESEQEVLATVTYMLKSGRVQIAPCDEEQHFASVS